MQVIWTFYKDMQSVFCNIWWTLMATDRESTTRIQYWSQQTCWVLVVAWINIWCNDRMVATVCNYSRIMRQIQTSCSLSHSCSEFKNFRLFFFFFCDYPRLLNWHDIYLYDLLFFPGCWVDTSVWWYLIFCCHERSSHEAPFGRPERPFVLFKAFLQKNHYQQHKAINLIFTLEFIRFYGLHHWLGKDCFQLQLTVQMILIGKKKKNYWHWNQNLMCQ